MTNILRPSLLFLIFSASFLMVRPVVHAQKAVCSDIIKVGKDEGRQYLAGSTAEGYYVAVENERTQSVELRYYLHDGFSLKHSVVVELPEGNKNQHFEKLLFLNDGFILFTGGYSKESAQYQIMATLLDNMGQKLGPASLVHYTVDQTTAKKLSFVAQLSPDQTKMLLLFDSRVEQKRDVPLSMKIYGRDLELLWEKELELPYESEILEVHNYAIDNAGDVYLMSGRNPVKDQIGLKTVQMGKHAVFYYNHVDKKLKEYNVGLRDKQVVSAIFAVQPSGDLMIAGYYSNDAEFAAAGTFLFTIGSGGGAVKAASMMPFSKDFLLKFLRERQVENRPTLTDYYLDHMVIGANGDILLVGEQYYISEVVNSDPLTGTKQNEFRYHFDNIIATSLQADGRQLWSTKISKTQFVLGNPEYCSYALFSADGGWEFYFNDALENDTKLSALPDGEATAWAGGSKSCVTRVVLKPTGEVTRSVWSLNEEDGLLLEPKWSGTATDSRVVLSRSKGPSSALLSQIVVQKMSWVL